MNGYVDPKPFNKVETVVVDLFLNGVNV